MSPRELQIIETKWAVYEMNTMLRLACHSSSSVFLQAYGGDGVIQRIKRVAFDARSTIMVSWLDFSSSQRQKLPHPTMSHRALRPLWSA